MHVRLRRGLIHDRLEVNFGGLLREVFGEREGRLNDFLSIVGDLDNLVLARSFGGHLDACDARRHFCGSRLIICY